MAKGIDKELKKIQKRGIYNPKVRVFSIIAIAVLTVGIGLTFSAFSYSSGDSQAFNSTVTKKVNITVKTTNGIINKDNGHILAGTLSAKILENNTVKTNPTFSSSHTDNGLYVQKGDNTKSIDGKPTYYFRGTVTNNFVSFAGVLWRIVRINEDGSVRLIRDGSSGESVYSSSSVAYLGSTIKGSVDTWYNALSDVNKNYITTTTFCNDITNTARSRLRSTPTFICPNGGVVHKLKAGIMTGDEIILAGASLNGYSPTYLNTGNWYWTMTADDSTHPFMGLNNGLWNYASDITTERTVRTVISLKAEALYKSGDGTSSSPYVVEGISTGTDTYTKESRYNKATDIYVNPYEDYIYDSISCDNGQSATYDSNSKKLTISAKKDTTCTVKFLPRKLNERILADNEVKENPNLSSSHTDNGLYVQKDDNTKSIDGKPTYYFRGLVTNNYVSFAGLIWRIVRINENETVRLIYTGGLDVSVYSTKGNTNYIGSQIETIINTWYENLSADNKKYIAEESFCNDITNTAATRLGSNNAPTFVCPSGANNLSLYAGALSADEYIYSGASYNTSSKSALGNTNWSWTMTATSDNVVLIAAHNSNANNFTVSTYTGEINKEGRNARQVINLKSDVTISSGDGTKDNPYIVE